MHATHIVNNYVPGLYHNIRMLPYSAYQHFSLTVKSLLLSDQSRVVDKSLYLSHVTAYVARVFQTLSYNRIIIRQKLVGITYHFFCTTRKLFTIRRKCNNLFLSVKHFKRKCMPNYTACIFILENLLNR